jgi:hypothetical protein
MPMQFMTMKKSVTITEEMIGCVARGTLPGLAVMPHLWAAHWSVAPGVTQCGSGHLETVTHLLVLAAIILLPVARWSTKRRQQLCRHSCQFFKKSKQET